MIKSTTTLTQDGLLAVLLERQRYKEFQLARRRAYRKHMRAVFWSALTWPWRALTAPKLPDDSADHCGSLQPPHFFPSRTFWNCSAL